jgi:SAM-dependent methyltransferase
MEEQKLTVEEFIERSRELSRHHLDFRRLGLKGKILDIGAGGEGVIGQLYPDSIGIDPDKEELEESPAKQLKIVMDGRDLQFMDETFDTVTIFFTMMYIHPDDHLKVFEEAYRVLKPGGELHLWYLHMGVPNEDTYGLILPLEIEMPGGMIQTGYGARWNRKQDDESFVELGKSAGLGLRKVHINGETGWIRFKKK